MLPIPKPAPKVKEVLDFIFQKAYTGSTTDTNHQSTSKSEQRDQNHTVNTRKCLCSRQLPWESLSFPFFNHQKSGYNPRLKYKITTSFLKVKIVLPSVSFKYSYCQKFYICTQQRHLADSSLSPLISRMRSYINSSL